MDESMNIDLDLDLDLQSDEIKHYLQKKLEEIQSNNAVLESTLDQQKQIFDSILAELNLSSHTDFKLEGLWVKMFNSKYAIWLDIENTSGRHLEEIDVLLHWDSDLALTYEFFILPTDDAKNILKRHEFTDCIQRKAKIVIIVESPQFLNQLTFKVNGSLIYKNSNSSKTINLPETLLNCNDSTDSNLNALAHNLLAQSLPDFLTCLVTSRKYNLVLKLPTTQRSLFSLLEIDCGFHKLDFGKSVCGEFYLSYKISSNFDGSIVELLDESDEDGIFEIVLYVKSHDNILALAHYLYSRIDKLILLPKDYLSMLKSETKSSSKLRDCLNEELQRVKDFVQNSSDCDSFKDFKLKLADLEKNSDEAYVRSVKSV